MLSLLRIFRGVGLRSAGTGHMVAPVFVELSKDLEFFVLGEIHLITLYLRRVGGSGGVGCVGTDFPGGIRISVGGVVLGGRMVEADSFHREFFEGRIALQLFLDDRTQIKRGNLKNFQRVPKLRSEDQRLGLTLAQFVAKSLPAHILDE